MIHKLLRSREVSKRCMLIDGTNSAPRIQNRSFLLLLLFVPLNFNRRFGYQFSKINRLKSLINNHSWRHLNCSQRSPEIFQLLSSLKNIVKYFKSKFFIVIPHKLFFVFFRQLFAGYRLSLPQRSPHRLTIKWWL